MGIVMTSNDQSNPAAATPVYNGGGPFANITTSVLTQLKSSAGVLQRVTVNTVGTGSAVAFFDGLSQAVTISIATPGVVTWPAGTKPAAGTAVKFSSTGALPTGTTANTTYYVSTAGATANASQIADTQAHALAGTNSINTSGSQSGVQTAWDVSRPIGTFTTTAQNGVAVGARFAYGLIAYSTDGGGAANLTVVYN
jgi:hypothetical protein